MEIQPRFFLKHGSLQMKLIMTVIQVVPRTIWHMIEGNELTQIKCCDYLSNQMVFSFFLFFLY